MPEYGSGPPGLSSTMGGAVWNNENVAAGKASVPISMHRNANMPNVVSVELSFENNPGAFGVDLQVADTDQEKYYVTKATMNSGLNPSFVGRMEVTNLVAKYARLKMVSLANNVKVTAKMF